MNIVSIIHNNIRSLNRNLDNLVNHYLQELGIHFNVIGVTETKITNSNENAGCKQFILSPLIRHL